MQDGGTCVMRESRSLNTRKKATRGQEVTSSILLSTSWMEEPFSARPNGAQRSSDSSCSMHRGYYAEVHARTRRTYNMCLPQVCHARSHLGTASILQHTWR